MSEKIQFQTNLPVELALQYLEGKAVDSQFGGVQHLFSTTDNRVFFVSEMVGNIIADQLKKLAVQKGEPVEICKAEVTQGRGRKSIQWIVKKVGSPVGEQPDGTFAVPAGPESALERQLRQSIATVRNGKTGTGAVTPVPGVAAAPNTEQPINNGNGSKLNGNGAAHNGRQPEIHQGWAQVLFGQTTALIDVYAAALNYAGTKHGNAVKPEDVKTLLTTAFINLSKGGHMLPSLPTDPEPRVIPAAPTQPAAMNDFGGVLSPSQVRTFRDCGAKWYYKYALGLPDPPNGSLVRGRVVHQMAEKFFRAKLDGGSPDPDDLQASFEEAWDREAAGAAFGADEDVDLLTRQAATLTRKYLDEVAPEIEPAALELPVQGLIGGVAVRGFVDLLDTSGRVIDLKTAVRKPTGNAR